MNLLNMLAKYKYAILFSLSISLNLLGILYIILVKNFYKIKLNKLRYNLLYILEFINILLFIIVFESQIYFIAKTNSSLILLLISYLNMIFLVLLILLNQLNDFKKELFPKIKKENIRNSIIFAFPLILPLILILFANKIKFYFIKNGFENYTRIIPFYSLLGYKNLNIKITFIIFIIPIVIIIVFLEEYYFRFILEYRHNKYIEIFSKIKEIEYIDYLKENKNHWIKFSILFSIYHLNLNPIAIIFLFLSSLYDFFYKSKCKSIIFNFLYHFIWDFLFYLIL